MKQPEMVIKWDDPFVTAQGWLVIDRLINGVCGGGTFMHPNATEDEVIDLARTMSYKNALQSIPFGGAKAGIRYDHTKPDAHKVLERFLNFLEPWLKTMWCTGADLNTCNHTMQAIISDMGLHSMFDQLGKMLARKKEIEDQSDAIFSRMNFSMTPYFSLSEGASGFSTAFCIGLMCKDKFPRVFIQGFGSVGRSLAYFIQHLNIGKVVGICDVGGMLYAEEGIDSMQLMEALALAEKKHAPMEQWLSKTLKERYHYTSRCCAEDDDYIVNIVRGKRFDVFSPCASRYTVTQDLIDTFAHDNHNVHIIAGANNVFDSQETRTYATQKGVVCFPEWISNCGNALLYEELLALREMPANYNAKIQETISDRITSFLSSALLDQSMPADWYELLVRTAENKLAIAQGDKPLFKNISIGL